ncbi:MAG TPA: choice-of-anchor tandem repeat GloVer-containing protein [Verrucomicrobiae bacterium]|jgi:uncharacterized repeat protein (TIGR03803 family)
MKIISQSLCLALALFVFTYTASAQTFTTLTSFPNNPGGTFPIGSLIQSGSILYGTANSGGSGGYGTVFAVNTNGTGFTALYSFTNGTDGARPDGNVVLSGNTLYGTAQNAGSAGFGTVFSVTTNGTNFKILYTFTNGTDGAYPEAGLVSSGNMLYGTTESGDVNGQGVIFAISTNGTGFTDIYSFTNGNVGADPEAGLIISGNKLYGTASSGGSGGEGTVFGVNTDGTEYTNIYNFSGNDGESPQATLVLSGNTLYGTTAYGGTAGNGTVFAVNTDSTGFTNLYNFTATAGDNYPYTNSDGATPYGGLVISGGTLYGTTSGGGNMGYGAVFSISATGINFTNLYTFTNGSDGNYPEDSLILNGSTLYGTANEGGNGSAGTVFAIKTDGTSFQTVYGFTVNLAGSSPEAGMLVVGNTLYGTTSSGGSAGYGTVFSINMNGTGLTNIYSFTPGTNGTGPDAGLILSGSTLYGTTYRGGSANYGTVFAVNTNGTGFRTVYSFTNGTDGANPNASLILSGSTLYGTAPSGGSASYGTVFAVNTNGTGFTTLYTFTNGADGAYPDAGLLLSGTMLYGTTQNGGNANFGTVFAVNTIGTIFTIVHTFAGGPNDGAESDAGLILSGNTLYGTTSEGGAGYSGTVFSINLSDGDYYTNLYSFTGGSDGFSPYVGLVLSGNTLYGASSGGGGSVGTVFSVNIAGTNFTTLYTFTNGPDGYYPYGLPVISGTILFGTTQSGGINNGTVYSLNLSELIILPPQLNINRSGTNVILSWSTAASGFTLLNATNIVSPVVWSTNLTTPVIVNSQYTVTNAATGPRRFYQLIH